MPSIDLTLLSTPVSAEEPCGADLDLTGDIGYLNFIAGVESLLPKSYFGKDKAGNEGRPFDRTSINFDEQFEAAKPFVDKTRDLRLIGILAKLCILNRDLAGFVACFNAISSLLATQWDHVHPRGEDGDFSFRAATLESLDVFPTVVLPLQFASLFEHKRLGSFSYRAYLIARGEVKPTEGEAEIDPIAVEKMLGEIELERLIAVRGQIGDLENAIKKIHGVWQEKCESGPSVSFDRGLLPLATQIFTLLNSAVVQRDPSAGIAEAETVAADGGEPNVAETDVASGLKIASAAQAARALAAVVDYFSRCEPSNPALIIVQQARDLLGKSFVDVLKVLVPEHVAKAAVNIGKEETFALPIERLAGLAAKIPGGNSNPPDGQGPEDHHSEIRTRTEALALLDQIGNYYRLAEPSSPIPFLTERARDLAQRDFLSVLKALLPANTLKNS